MASESNESNGSVSHDEFRASATGVTVRIIDFEKYLAVTSNAVPCHVEINKGLTVSVGRFKGAWRLWAHRPHYNTLLVADAPTDVKIEVLHNLAKVMKTITDSRTTLAKQCDRASDAFDKSDLGKAVRDALRTSIPNPSV